MQRGSRQSGRGVSRRHFLRDAATGAAAAASTSAAGGAPRSLTSSGAESHSAPQPIRIPPEFSAAAQIPPASLQFLMTGARVFAQAGKDEGVAVTHAADAFIRMSGEIAVASGTEGPG
jgi:hypothetical protein